MRLEKKCKQILLPDANCAYPGTIHTRAPHVHVPRYYMDEFMLCGSVTGSSMKQSQISLNTLVILNTNISKYHVLFYT